MIINRRFLCLYFVVFVAISLFIVNEFSFKENMDFFDINKIHKKENLIPLLICGSGPAALSAALYGSRMRIDTFVLKGSKPGGQLMGTSFIENWPAIKKIKGIDVMENLQDQAKSFGAIMLNDSLKSIDLSIWPYVVKTEEGKTLNVMSLVIATGATPKKLNIEGEDKYWGQGVTTCAICDAPYHKGDDVVVIGGGDSAIEEALELSSYAKNVKILVRSDSMRASKVMIEKLKDCSNIEICFNSQLLKINGNEKSVTSVKILNNKTQIIKDLNIQGVFLAIGHEPNSKYFKNYLNLDENGYIKLLNRTQQTNKPGVFAAGDVADFRYRQAGVAAGDGIKAGLDAVWWLTSLGYNGQIILDSKSYLFFENDQLPYEFCQINSIEELNIKINENKDKLVVLDFYNKYCPSCINIFAVIESVGKKMKDSVVFFKVNTELSKDLCELFNVKSVPYLISLKKGQIILSKTHEMTKQELLLFIQNSMIN